MFRDMVDKDEYNKLNKLLKELGDDTFIDIDWDGLSDMLRVDLYGLEELLHLGNDLNLFEFDEQEQCIVNID